MELKLLFVDQTGAYLVVHDQIKNKWIGAFCWSGEQIFRLLQIWSVSIEQTTGTATFLSKPENALVPKTHARQPIVIDGSIAAHIAQHFERINILHEMGKGKQITSFPPIPPAHIIGCFIDASDKAHQTAVVFYTEPNGTPNMVIIRNQLQGLMVLSFSWMNEEQRTSCQKYLQNLPVMGDDEFEVPTLVQGDIIKLLIASILIQRSMIAESS